MIITTTADITTPERVPSDLDVDGALAWYRTMLDGDAWGTSDIVEVENHAGERTVHITVWGSSWTLEVDIEEPTAADKDRWQRTANPLADTTNSLLSVRVTDPATREEIPEQVGVAAAFLP